MKFDQSITVHDLFKDSFCATIDLRSNEDNNSVYGSGVLLELTKSAVTSKDHTIYVFVVSDRLVNFINDQQSIQC